jgi:hypothetical protein
MALSDTENGKKRDITRRRAISAETNKQWSDNQKIEAVQTYLALGKITLTSAVLKIPEITLRKWKSTDWWKEIENELRVQDDLVLSSKLQNLINKSLETVQDRLENGDYIYDNKAGKLVRKPVNMRDAHKVTMDMVDKRDYLINKVPAQQSADALEDKLAKLAEKFAQIAGSVKAPVIVTDVIEVEAKPVVEEQEWTVEEDEPFDMEIIDAVHEEREEGLQEGK